MIVTCKLLTDYHLEFLSLNVGCRGSSESTHVKMPHCWKSHALAHFFSEQGVRGNALMSKASEQLVRSVYRSEQLADSKVEGTNRDIITNTQRCA